MGRTGGKGPAGANGDRPRRRGRRWLLAGLGSATGAAVLLFGPTVVVTASTASDRYGSADPAPHAPVAIVLGAGVDGAGRPSPFLSARIATAVGLYRSGAVRVLLMSGDNSRPDYDEVGVMTAQAVRLGVPASAVVSDHAGFDTYSSCYRARSVWGIGRAVLVTQPFHLPRAVWLCRRLGLDAVGVAADSGDASATWYGRIRELPAVDKAWLDVLRGRLPMFPGPREHTLDPVIAGAA